MNIPKALKYTKTHEWVKTLDNGNVRVGITDHAQQSMGDIVYVELPEVGDELVSGATFGVVESVKAVSDVYSPVSGKVAAVNEALLDSPELINEDAYSAWLMELSDAESGELLTPEEYEEALGQEE